jgi:nicotinamide riboside transporter PnuC
MCTAIYIWPRLKAAEPVEAHRAIATLHSFRFFGLVFLLPGFVGTGLPLVFAMPAAFGDLSAALLAIAALLAVRVRILFWPLVVAFNIVGIVDLVMDTAVAVSIDLPSKAGQLGAAYAIPMLYVPLLFWTHVLAFRLLWRFARASMNGAQHAGALL